MRLSAAKVDSATSIRSVSLEKHEASLEQVKADKCSKHNGISTAKYTVLTFLPVNLFEQYHRACNIYFTLLVFLQLYPPVQTLPVSSTLVPLILVLTITAVKDGYDDYKRHVMDRKLNDRKSRVLKDGKWVPVAWKNMLIGEVVKVEADEPVPADLVLLTTGEDAGECYLDTADLDGETNLKRKETHPDIFEMVNKDDLETSVKELKGNIEFEFPNTNLESFRGSMKTEGADTQDVPLNHKNILLRGCTLRNTKYVIGIIVYAGHDTKIMKNTGAGRLKRTHLDLQLDWLVLTVRGRPQRARAHTHTHIHTHTHSGATPGLHGGVGSWSRA